MAAPVAPENSLIKRLGKARCPGPNPASSQASPFEAVAADYDSRFTHSLIGTLMRQAVWRRLEACFRPGEMVLELNCGTGEDAVYLGRRGVKVLATDISPAMLKVARDKVGKAGLAELVKVQQLDLAEPGTGGLNLRKLAGEPTSQRPARGFDGAFSNFGGLNCVADLPGVAAGLASCLRPGAGVLLCLMGPLVPWEWLWFLWRRQPSKAFRRLSSTHAWWRGLRIYYPSLRTARRSFRGHFRLRRVSALGVLMPPPFAESWAAKHPQMLACLSRWERRLETVPPLPWLADHYLLELERWTEPAAEKP